jgi:5-methylcytosine-specific restriction endonuclease McrA
VTRAGVHVAGYTCDRGSSRDRAARVWWLLRRYGNGIDCPCLLRISPRCEKRLSRDTLTVDKVVPARAGGKYRHPNIIPACGPCNRRKVDKPLTHVMSRRRVRTLLKRMEAAQAACGCRSCKNIPVLTIEAVSS